MTFRVCSLTQSISFAAVSSTRRSPTQLAISASVLLRSLEQGRIEERLAHLESVVGNGDNRGGIFEFRSKSDTMEAKNERPNSTASVD